VGVTPANAEVKYKRNGEPFQVFRQPSMSLDAGTYEFTAHAAGYVDGRRNVEVLAGGSQTVNFGLSLAKVIPEKPIEIVHTMKVEDWDKPWSQEDAWYTRQGGEFVLYRFTPAAGIFRFAISPKASRGFLGIGGNPKMRWVIGYTDPKNYIEFQIDKQSYSSEEYRNGKKIEHTKKKAHGLEATSFSIQMIVTAGKISVEVSTGDHYEKLDEWADADRDFTAGRFGFHLPNQDQIYMTNFSFTQQPGAGNQ
jgi:hypothetical protein